MLCSYIPFLIYLLSIHVDIVSAPDHFPDITLCPFPSYNHAKLRSYGYYNSFDYAKVCTVILHIKLIALYLNVITLKGRINSHMRGWSGNSSNTTPEDIINDISFIRTVEDCPKTKVNMRLSEKAQYVALSFELTSEVYPSGRCCRAIIPEQASSWTVSGLLLKIETKDHLPSVEGFQVHLSDRESANVFHRNKFNIDGIELKASKKTLGYILYNLKMHRAIHLEGDRKYPCKNYLHIGDFNEVKELETHEKKMSR